MYHRSHECAPGQKVNLAWDDLPPLFPEFDDPGRWLPLLQRHASLIEAAAPAVRVSSVSPADAIRRHYAESLELLRLIELDAPVSDLADVGSGGGWPGLVVAAVRPGAEVHLIEPLQKRARLLVEVSAALGLPNVHVHPQRAEEAGRGPLRDVCTVVTARAVASLSELLEYTSPLTAHGGRIVLPKGSAFEGEIASAGPAMQALGVSLSKVVPMRPDISEAVRVAMFEKQGATDARYPRRPGTPAKRPL
jgi:16S rRNA (guanine527-N7)-methyltransferase